jgi:hypothetical protein
MDRNKIREVVTALKPPREWNPVFDEKDQLVVVEDLVLYQNLRTYEYRWRNGMKYEKP